MPIDGSSFHSNATSTAVNAISSDIPKALVYGDTIPEEEKTVSGSGAWVTLATLSIDPVTGDYIFVSAEIHTTDAAHTAQLRASVKIGATTDVLGTVSTTSVTFVPHEILASVSALTNNGDVRGKSADLVVEVNADAAYDIVIRNLRIQGGQSSAAADYA